MIRSSDTAASCYKKCRLDPISFNFAAQGYHQRHPPVLFLGTTLYLPFFVFVFYHCICLCACFFLFYFLSLIPARSTLRCTAITNAIVFKNFAFVFVMSCLIYVFVFFYFLPLIRYHPYLSFDLTLSSHFTLEIGSSLQCRDITNGNDTLTECVVSAPKAGDELINLDNVEILLPKQYSGSSVAVIIII